ncbi:selenium metabolism-associated LysR family transcriptional regulator [Thalassobacillus devorans]|uniref:selenium metabolism-associated LysR family transcriptional regulator n=1 Tax=Thalassobacillus devorans TaxID=279813 RepID=UPI00048D77D4|nr:selenium metabolism-associated LysR family transcriptional regulator [Thalassobacillus devorans]
MNLNHLKAFVKVAELKNYQEVARLIGVSQPAVSQRMKALEDHFQTKLISRTPQGISLTPQGEMFYEESKEILVRWERMEAYYLQDQPIGNLAIGASTIPSEYLLPKLLKEFRSQYPAVHFSMQVAGSRNIQDLLLERQVDLIVTGKPERHDQIESIPFYKDQLTLIMPRSVTINNLKMKDLLQYDWIVREQHSDTKHTFEQALSSRGFHVQDLHVVGQVGSSEAVIAAVEAGLGVSVVSALAAERAERYGRIKTAAINDLDISREFFVSCLKENQQFSTIATFVDFVTREV